MATSFRQTAWIFPAAYVVHVAEEAPGFTAWARRNASTRYTQSDFVRNNTLGFVSAIAATVAITRTERRALSEHRLSQRDVVACTLVAGVVHAAVVARQVYLVGSPRNPASEAVAQDGNGADRCGR